MQPIQVSRRQVLSGLLVAPVISWTGCGGTGDSDAGPASGTFPSAADSVPGGAVPAAEPFTIPGQVKQVIVYYEYQGDVLETVQKNLHTVPTNVTATADRFAQGALCYEFYGSGSRVTVNGIKNFPRGDFAILFWVKSPDHRQMEALRIKGAEDGVVVVEINDAGELTVLWNGRVVAGTSAHERVQSLADGHWHHITVQRYGSSLQLFVDGSARGVFFAPRLLPENPTVLVGRGWSGEIDDVRLYNRAFPTRSIPQSVYCWTQVKPNTATGNLAAYYPFNGNARNDLGYGIQGIPSNVTPTSDRFNTSGAAYLFNGSDSYITLDQPLSSTAGDFAIAFWERSSATGPMTAISASSGGSAGTSLDVVFNQGAALQIYLNGLPFSALSVGMVGALTDDNWHFVFLQRSGTTLQMYVDGSLAAAAEDESIFFGQSSIMQFGRGSGASAAVANYWNGALDDVQIHESSLTPQEIVDLQGLQFRTRDGAGALSFQGKAWLLGGWNPANVPVTNSEVWSSADGVNWLLVTKAPWEGRHDAGYAVLNDKMWIVGGDKNSGAYQNDVWSSADGVNWVQVTDNVPWADRATQYVLAFNNRLWLMGGQQVFESSPAVVAYNDVYSSADGVSWRLETPSAAWSPRGIIMGNVVFQGRMWVIGGGQYDVRTFNNDVWSSPDGINWTQILDHAPWSPRQFHNITVFDNKMWVLAGGDAQSQGGLNDVWYSTDGKVWTELAAASWMPRHAASTFVLNNYLWFACGSNASPYNDVWKLGYAP